MNKSTKKEIRLKIIICIAIFMLGIMFNTSKAKAALKIGDFKASALSNNLYTDGILNTLGSTVSDEGAAYGTTESYIGCIHEASISRSLFFNI